MASPNLYEDNKGKITKEKLDNVIVHEIEKVDGNTYKFSDGTKWQQLKEEALSGKVVIIKDPDVRDYREFYAILTNYGNSACSAVSFSEWSNYSSGESGFYCITYTLMLGVDYTVEIKKNRYQMKANV